MPQQLAGRNSGIVVLGKWLQRQGGNPSEHPAFGGVNPVHVAGSYHYKAQAFDAGDATNSPDLLQRVFDVLYSNPQAYGVAEVFYKDKGYPTPVAGHDDHLHVAIAGPPTEELLKLVSGESEDSRGFFGELVFGDPLKAFGLGSGQGLKDAIKGTVLPDTAAIAADAGKWLVSQLFKTIGDEGARALLYLALVIGGSVLVYYGVARAAGVNKPIGTPAGLAVKKGA